MDQDSFRQLLSSQKAGDSSKGTGSTSRGSLLKAGAKPKKIDASQPAFKPRKVKQATDGKYRDRALERRHGEAGDFAHVEALLADFEKQAQDAGSTAEVEEKRKYLGGDSEHSVLVKGLDFALLEQNKARAALVSDKFDDESLEKVFQEVASVDNPKKAKTKKTREELLRELKEKRSSGANEAGEGEQTLAPEEETRKLEMAKQQGKFKPIGFKPIGQPAAEPKKKKKAKADGIDGERKKKKRKLDSRQGVVEEQPSKPEATVQPAAPPPPPEPEQEPIEDFDIFAGAGDYDGLELGDDDDEDDAKPERKGATVEDEEEEDQDPSTSTRPKQWISIEEDGAILRPKSPEPPQSASPPEPSSSKAVSRDHEEEDGEMDEDVPMKLVPLASSALPSVRDFLDMDRAATSSRKNKKRKDKKKATQDPDSQTANAEAKAERDYKRLKAYTDKKAS